MYLVFGYYDYYPSGGFDDLIYMDKELGSIVRFLSSEVNDNLNNFQVVDVEKDIIIYGDLTTVTNDLRDYHWDALKDYLEELFG